jgi:hypothetical protein
VVTIDVTDTAVDEVVARARSASLTAGMRAYYHPDELRDVTERLDAERGYPARVTCRVNDQRAMIMRADREAYLGEVTAEQISHRLAETSLTWLGPRENMHEQANILVENRSDVVSLHMMWDRWSLTDEQVEALLRGVEAVAVEAAFDPAAPTKVLPARTKPLARARSGVECGQAQIAQFGIVVGGHHQVRVARVAGEFVDEAPPDSGGRLPGRHHPHPPGSGPGPYRGECVTEHQPRLVLAGRQLGEVSGGEVGDAAGRHARMLAHVGDPCLRRRAVTVEHGDTPVLRWHRYRAAVRESPLLDDDQQRPPDSGRRSVLAGNPQAAEGRRRALVTNSERHWRARSDVTEIRGSLPAGPQVVDGERQHQQVNRLVC